jgi:hypothetical protein
LEATDVADGTDALILGSHGATVKPLKAQDLPLAPRVMVFSSPNEMLQNKDFVAYLNLLYQNGHEIVFDTSGQYEFNMSKQTD